MPTATGNTARKYGDRVMVAILATPSTDKIRTETYLDVEHIVVPAIILNEGVLWPANAPFPELALSEEFGRFPDSWNGRPVTLNHPTRKGIPVSANSPDVLAEYQVGYLFNTKLVGKKLHSELWINTEMVEALGEDAQADIERLQSGESVVEISTGLYSQLEEASGQHEGEEFEAIWRNIVPDHLAILPAGVVGACSVADGCGAPRVSGTALPSAHKGVNVAIRLGAEGISNQAKASAEDPMPKDNAHTCTCQHPKTNADEEQSKMFKSLMTKFKEKLGDVMSFRTQAGTSELSDNDIRRALETALGELKDCDYFWIVAVFRGNDSIPDHFIYEHGYMKLVQRTFEITDDGVVKLGTDIVPVRPVTTFVPVEVSLADDVITSESNDDSANHEEETQTMAIEEKVKSLVDNAATKFTEEDSAWLSKLDEGNLDKLIASAAQPAPATTAEPAKTEVTPPTTETQKKEVTANAGTEEPKKPQTADEYIAAAPEGVREMLQEGVQMRANCKKQLVEGLKANANNSFTDRKSVV